MNLVDITSTSSEVHKRDSSSCALIKLYFVPPHHHHTDTYTALCFLISFFSKMNSCRFLLKRLHLFCLIVDTFIIDSTISEGRRATGQAPGFWRLEPGEGAQLSCTEQV